MRVWSQGHITSTTARGSNMKNFKMSLAAAAVSAGLTMAIAPQPAQAQSIVDLARVIVNVNDIVYRGGVPYYRYGQYRPEDRIIVVRENGRRTYYRNAPRGVAHGYYGTQPGHNKSRDDDRRYEVRKTKVVKTKYTKQDKHNGKHH